MSGATDCWGASWSEQLDGKELRGALGSAIETERISVFLDIVYQFLFINYKNCDIMLISKGCISPVVPL